MRNVLIALCCIHPVLASTIAFAAERIRGEALVLAGETAGQLLGTTIAPRTIVVVRSTYLPDAAGCVTYKAGRDYRLDSRAGTIARTPGSRIPDFATNVLFGKDDFDHSRFPGYGNTNFFVYVDYTPNDPVELTPATPTDVAVLLPRTAEKLRGGRALKVVAFGDSITAGGEASSVELQYPSRYVQHLRERFPAAQITLENGATGGDNTVMGLARLDEKVLTRKPDLVLVAFGMNDHNIPDGGGVTTGAFEKNLEQIVDRIRDKTGAEVILLSAFPPNPNWHFSSHQMEKYAAATQRAAKSCHVAYADVYAVWQKALARKDPPSLLANNINHPNDFGHWLYLLALESLKF